VGRQIEDIRGNGKQRRPRLRKEWEEKGWGRKDMRC
jgi:hypothetical protein